MPSNTAGAPAQAAPHPPDAATADRCRAYLEKLLAQASSIEFACIGTADGRLFASDGAGGAQRLAAMASSMLALSESFAKEALRSQCTHSTIVTRHGVIVTVRIPSRQRAYLLSIGADATDVMALVLRRALDASEQLADILDSPA